MPSHASGLCHARAERGEVARDAHVPVVDEVRRVAERRRAVRQLGALLLRRRGERDREDADVIDQITERVVGARRRPAERVVGNVAHELREPLRGGSEIQLRHCVPLTE